MDPQEITEWKWPFVDGVDGTKSGVAGGVVGGMQSLVGGLRK